MMRSCPDATPPTEPRGSVKTVVHAIPMSVRRVGPGLNQPQETTVPVLVMVTLVAVMVLTVSDAGRLSMMRKSVVGAEPLLVKRNV